MLQWVAVAGLTPALCYWVEVENAGLQALFKQADFQFLEFVMNIVLKNIFLFLLNI